MAINISQIIQVLLTIFYGQLLAVAVYDLIIYGSTDLNHSSEKDFYFNLSRIIIGTAMILCSIVSLVIIWLKFFRVLFVSGVLLSLVFAAYVVTYAIYLTFNFQDLEKNIKYPLLVEFVFKSTFMLLASFSTFFLASRGTYLYLNVDDIE
jgi:hypothetical protein